MDVFYEESAIANNSKKESRKYKILQIISNVFLWSGILLLLFEINFFPVQAWFLIVLTIVFFGGIWFLTWRWKKLYNVSYDYCFVSGELRISKVFNINKRKLCARFDCAEIIQMGDAENPSYERFSADPSIKTVFCTSNAVAAEGKFFMYILIENNGKKLYVLECRETLLMHILRFVKRTTLESDYVMQEKKKDRI